MRNVHRGSQESRLKAAAAIAAAVGISAAGCSSSSHHTSGHTSAGTPTAGSGTLVGTTHTSLGTFLSVGGKTVYLFEKDTGPSSQCSGPCAASWPPVTSQGAPTAASGVSAGLLGTLQRSDGGTQVSYAGHPLYFYAGDANPGQTSGEGSKQFGAGWYVVAPTGKKIDNS